MRFAFALAVVVLVGTVLFWTVFARMEFGGVYAPPDPPPSPESVRLVDPFERFMNRYVAGGFVNYARLQARDRRMLDDLILAFSRDDTTGWDPARCMARNADLYNLVMIRAVLDRWTPGWTPAADGFAVFKAPLVPTRDGPISLDELEKERTMARHRDPRLHVAFNCAARSCPRLTHRSFTGARPLLLDELMTEFVRDSSRNQVDDAQRVLRLSRIFDWYQADFGGRVGVLRTVSKHLGRDVSGYRVEFLEYDWSLNAMTYPDGSRPR